MEVETVSNQLHDALINKSNDTFWKVWKNKFGGSKKQSFAVIEGSTDCKLIADKFASHFEKCCSPNSALKYTEKLKQFTNEFQKYTGDQMAANNFTDIFAFDQIIFNLKSGKSGGFDGLVAEHLKYCHPSIMSTLTKLFNLMMTFCYIPDKCGEGLTILIPKENHSKTTNTIENFRGISVVR